LNAPNLFPTDGTALIFCEGALGTPAGRTANNLLRFSRRYEIVGVIDSTHAGRDAADVVEDAKRGVPVFASLDDALAHLPAPPQRLVVGLSPADGRLPSAFRQVLRESLVRKIGVDSALRPYLHDDPEFPQLAMSARAGIRSVGYPKHHAGLRLFTGEMNEIGAHSIAVVGTGAPVGGKNVTAVRLVEELNRRGMRAEMVGTSEASWFQGVPHTVLLDSVPQAHVAGELEAVMIQAWRASRPSVLVLEGAGSPFDSFRPSGIELLTTARLSCVILQHAPAQTTRGGATNTAIIERHVRAVEAIADCPIAAVALSHTGFAAGTGICGEEIALCRHAATELRLSLGIPICDVLADGAQPLADLVCHQLTARPAAA
jgi:uncharacterized NAD-dependent epimerase/dehydratase family protein